MWSTKIETCGSQNKNGNGRKFNFKAWILDNKVQIDAAVVHIGFQIGATKKLKSCYVSEHSFFV